MKKTLALILAALFCLALFAGCGGQQTTPTQQTETQPAQTETQQTETQPAETQPAETETTEPAETTEPEPAETEEPSPYNLAAGKFKADAQGLALEKYEYELPLSTTDEVFDMWTVSWTPDYLPEGGYGAMEFPTELQKRTGVNVEYVTVTSDKRQENFSVLIASDDLCDIMCSAETFYNGNFRNAVEEEAYFANLYDYREYIPNYIYEARRDPEDLDTINRVFYDDGLIMSFYELKDVLELNSGAFARGDWLEDMGKTNADILTFDDLHEMLTFFKNEEGAETPMTIFKTIELAGAYEFVGYDTYASCSGIRTQYVKDGQVQLSNTTERDRKLMTMLNQWYSEGLIDPNWAGYGSLQDFDQNLDNGRMGYVTGTRPTTMVSHNAFIPEGHTGWVAISKPAETRGQTLHMGFQIARIYWGSAAVAASCENIPLICSWLDYRYSEAGKFFFGYGVEGVSWEYDDNGNITITDMIIQHPAYWSMIMPSYALNSLCEPGLYVNYTWLVPGNEVAYQYLLDWEFNAHDNAYVYPSGITFNNDQTDELAKYGSDLETYLSENYLAFIDGSKPLSEWDAYEAQLHEIGLDEVLAVYQEAYDAYIG